MKKRWFSMLAKLMAVVLIFTAAPVYNAEVLADEIKYGDIDSDEQINAQDALVALKYAAKMVEFSETAFVKGDVDGSNTVDAKDALLILKYAAKMIDKFPVEEAIVDPTDVPSGDPTVGPTLVPTEEVTEAPSEEPKFESFPINVVYEGEIATVDGDTITFNHPSISNTGVMLENPFAGKDTSNGLAISFWMRTTETTIGNTYTFRALLTALRDTGMQAVKFDIEGTRQLATVDGDKLNYWEANDAYINADDEYFITLIVNPDGLDYYVDGYSVGYTGYAGIGESTAAATAMALFAMDTTALYLGGVEAADVGLQNSNRIYDHKLPEGTIISGLTGYLGNFTESDVEDLYLSVKEGHEPIPTTAPTTPPTPEPTEEVTPAPEETPSTEPDPTEAPVESEEPTPTEEVTPAPDAGEVIPFSGRFIIAGDSIADGVEGTDAIGWGDVVHENFTSDVTVKNEAHLGDSCLSYFYDWDGNGDSHGRWQNAYWCEAWKDHSHNQCTHDSDDDHLGKNDYIIISFGHNDANTAANRYASATAPTSEKGSFKWWLKEKYIDPALSVGAVPILMTPIVRCTYDSNGKFTETETHLSYGQAMRDLVAEYAANGTEIILIDAQQYTYDYLSNTSKEEASKLYASGATTDITHMNEEGAAWLADYVTSELAKLPLAIKQFIK